MYHQLSKFFLSQEWQMYTRKRWMGGFLNLEKAFKEVPHWRLLKMLEYIKGLKETLNLLDWRLPEGKRNENSSKGWKIRLEGSKKWVLQRSVWAPIIVLVYIDDIIEGVSRHISLFAEESKLLRNHMDCTHKKICAWSKTWKIEFQYNKKFHVLEMGRSRMRLTRTTYINGKKKKKRKKDLGVVIHDNLFDYVHFLDKYMAKNNI